MDRPGDASIAAPHPTAEEPGVNPELDRFVALGPDRADAQEERGTILPAHRVVAQLRDRATA
jgi:hypothetical protein